MITKNLLIIPGSGKLTIVDVNEYKINGIINVPSSSFYGICLLNQKMILSCDVSGTIFQFKIEGDNLILTSKKEKAHKDCCVNFLLNMGDGFVASGSDDYTIKIW